MSKTDKAEATGGSGSVEFFDTIIVGAGAAGIYSMYRLHEAGRLGKRALVLDANPRLRGRVHTQTVAIGEVRAEGELQHGKPTVLELGAMRFMAHHALLRGLVDHLDLETEVHDFPIQSYFLRGQRLPFNCGAEESRGVSPRFDDLYKLDHDERNRSPDELFKLAIFRALKRVYEKSYGNGSSKPGDPLKSWLEQVLKRGPQQGWPVLTGEVAKKLREDGQAAGSYLTNVAFWNLIQRFVSVEAFHLIRDGLGYYTVTSEWNAAEALVRFVNEVGPGVRFADSVGASAPYVTVKGGMNKVLDGMIDKVFRDPEREVDDTRLKLDHHVDEIRREETEDGQPLYRVIGRRPANEEGVLGGPPNRLANGLPEFEFTARNVIVAVPCEPFSEIKFSGFKSAWDWPKAIDPSRYDEPLEAYKLASRRFISGHRLQKMLLCYDEAWWKRDHILGQEEDRSKVISDSAIRQIYFDDKQGVPYLMLYVDGAPLGAWKSFEYFSPSDTAIPFIREVAQRPKSEDAADAGVEDSGRLEQIYVSMRMYDRIRHELADVLCIEADEIPTPVAATVKTWADWPEYYGWHAWGVAARSDMMRQVLSKPTNDTDSIFGICSESYSTTQGWIEGAFRSAESMLKDHSVPMPGWSGKFKWSDIDLNLTNRKAFNDYIDG